MLEEYVFLYLFTIALISFTTIFISVMIMEGLSLRVATV
jgi:hypothetical protein